MSATCGDRKVDKSETCDDGDRADGDGCDGTCGVEDGWTCTGAPSVCVKCGNGALETGEECDDNNGDDGDGCSKDCKIEGSCTAPALISLKSSKGVLSGSVNSTTSKEDMGQVEEAACGGEMAGGGADRVFEFDLDNPADIVVRVGASFDAVVRVTSKPCDLTTELPNTCTDNGAVGEEEVVELNNTPAGKYFVIVDGKTAQQAGTFSVSVEASCPLVGLKIDRVFVTEPFRTVLFNSNQSCAIDLSRVGVYAQPEAPDGPKTLPAVTLEPLKKRVLTSESPPPQGTTFQGTIPFDADGYAGAYYLCRGECDTAKGTNVFDAVRWNGDSGKPKVAPPSTVSFDANVAALADRTKMSFFRVSNDGVAPNFKASDFVGAFYAETFEDSAITNWTAPSTVFYKTTFDPVMGTIGAFSLDLTGNNDKPGIWNGPKFTFRDSQGMPDSVSPTYVSLRARGSDKTVSQGWCFFGNPGAETAGFGSFFRDGVATGSLALGATGPNQMPVQTIPYKPDTWYFIEYKNFMYTPVNNPTGGTVDVYVDTVKRATLTMTTPSISEINLRNLGATSSSVWFDQIIVR
ncbi:MAG TPA: DUF4215 domain-containing protein [Polyangiaceae bacterium]|nr:DUF4215 domain-containing protein [Polyangiaceae bacterium]